MAWPSTRSSLRSGADPCRLPSPPTDEKGQSAQKTVDLKADTGAGVVLLRPDRATYRVGDTMHLTALTSQNFGSLFLDIVRDGQTLSTRSEQVKDGRAEFAVDLSGDLYGALTLHAYKVLADGSIIRDTRVVVVDAPRDVTTEITGRPRSVSPRRHWPSSRSTRARPPARCRRRWAWRLWTSRSLR